MTFHNNTTQYFITCARRYGIYKTTLLSSVFCLLASAMSVAFADTDRIAPPLSTLIAEFEATPAETAAGATVINHITNIVVQSDGSSLTKEYIAVTLLNDKAIDEYRQISQQFNSYFTQAHLDFARVLDSHGRMHEVSSDGAQIQSPNEPYMLDDQRILTLAMPGLDKNATLEFQVSYLSKPKISGQWFGSEFFSFTHWIAANRMPRIDPVRSAKIVFEVPNDKKLLFESQLIKAPPIRNMLGNRTRYAWDASNIPAIKVETNMHGLSDQIPHVEITTIPSWALLDDWGKDIYLSAIDSSEEEHNLVSKLITEKMTRRQRIESLFYYIENNIRYINAHLTRGGFKPHSSSNVLMNRYGDCKDQAILLVALLREAGITAYPTLINRTPGADLNRNIPSLAFSHMIVYVPDEHGDIWLDTTGSASRFPGIDSSLENQTALIINGAGGQLKVIPQSSAAQNSVKLQIYYSYQNGKISARTDFIISGVFSDRMKPALRNDPNPSEKLQDLIKGMYPYATSLKVATDPHIESSKPLAFSANYEFPDSWSAEQEIVRYGGDMTALISMFTPLVNLPSPDTREYDFFVGMPMTLTMVTHCPAPSTAYRPIVETPGQPVTSAIFFTRHDHRIDDQSVEITSQFVLEQPLIMKSQYADFSARLLEALKQAAWRVSFRKDSNYAKEVKLQETIQSSGRSTDSVLELARHELAIANYTKARDLAKEAINKEPTRGEAHYLLGIALGFLDDYHSSDQALQKAKSLGYKP